MVGQDHRCCDSATGGVQVQTVPDKFGRAPGIPLRHPAHLHLTHMHMILVVRVAVGTWSERCEGVADSTALRYLSIVRFESEA